MTAADSLPASGCPKSNKGQPKLSLLESECVSVVLLVVVLLLVLILLVVTGAILILLLVSLLVLVIHNNLPFGKI